MIRVLPQTLINQIAAGEVIVRMASVVKELVENAIDAGASRIEVILGNELRDVEVRDNGCGMNREDAELCLQRHATSKISNVDDLFALRTRGFRGEAMPSIASVSRMEIQTRPAEENSGTRVQVEGGRIQRIEAFGCPVGTRMIVRDLFYNTPARRKFLKSTISENNSLMSIITRQAIAQPHIGFRVEREGREVMDLPDGQTLAERFASILGSHIKRPLLKLDYEEQDIRVTGLLAHPNDARGDRRSQFFFVNDRPFTCKSLSASLEQACRGFVMTSRFPVCCVFVTVDPGEVDLNVHPTKEEVRFQNERLVAGRVFHAARKALEGAEELIGEMHLDRDEEPAPRPTAPTLSNGNAQPTAPPPPNFFTSPDRLVQRAFERKQVQSDMLFEAAKTQSPTAPAPQAEVKPPRVLTSRHADGSIIAASPGERPDHHFWDREFEPEPLGQVAETYVVARYGESLLLVDQHAAHERLVYLQLRKRRRNAATQPLLIPITVELPPAQSESLRELLPVLEELGFEVGEFGPRTWAVKALPADLPEFDPGPMIAELVDDLREAKAMNALEDLRDRILIRTACHSAIRAGQRLPMEEMRELLRQVCAEKLSLTCPHGRPTIIRLSKTELDKQFKRIV